MGIFDFLKPKKNETKKSIERQTLFLYEDGTIDHTRGAGISLYNKLDFFLIELIKLVSLTRSLLK